MKKGYIDKPVIVRMKVLDASVRVALGLSYPPPRCIGYERVKVPNG